MIKDLPPGHASFACSQCGACCRRAGDIDGFPEPTDADGSCTHLSDANRCGIYDSRPEVCRVNGFWERHLSEHLPLEEWHRINHERCNKMINEDGMDAQYLMETS